jgi:predicted acylesterase/phospholipase RssA/CRP-like cAMP-binding protein
VKEVSLIDEQEKRVLLRRTNMMSVLEEKVFEDIVERLEWLMLNNDEILCRTGEPADKAYILIHGRLDIFVEDQDAHRFLIDRVYPGDSVGEMALLTDHPRSATVVAARPSLLAMLSRDLFTEIVNTHKTSLLGLTRQFARKIRDLGDPLLFKTSQKSRAPGRVIAILDECGRVTTDLIKRLVPWLQSWGGVHHIRYTDLETGLHGDDRDAWRISQYIDRAEQEAKWLLLDGSGPTQRWRELCADSADTILFVATARAAPRTEKLPAAWKRKQGQGLPPRRELVMLRDSSEQWFHRGLPWRLAVGADIVHNVDLSVPSSIGHLARMLTGRAVALVLSGGAARGGAHAGALRAIEEAGIPIDIVGGTSVGAVFAALIAQGIAATEVEQMVREAFKFRIYDITPLPVLSLFSGRNIKKEFRCLCRDRVIEDLPLAFYATSNNLSRAEIVVHRSGLLYDALEASGAMVGLYPPVKYGKDLLVDGVFLSNLPADQADEICMCRKIAVNLVPITEEKKLPDSFETIPRLRLLYEKFRHGIGHRPPLILDLAMRGAQLCSVQDAIRIADEVDVFIEPAIERFNYFDLSAFDQLSQEGYKAACLALKGWQENKEGRS